MKIDMSLIRVAFSFGIKAARERMLTQDASRIESEALRATAVLELLSRDEVSRLLERLADGGKVESEPDSRTLKYLTQRN